MTPVKTIHGIEFFNSPKSCVRRFNQAPHCFKAFSFVQSWWNYFTYLLGRAVLIWKRAEAQITTHPPIDGFSKQRLIVCLHGLNDNPSQFKKISDEIYRNNLSETDVYIPRLLRKGNAKLDDVIKPLMAEIARWSASGAQKELVLVGISNGARVAQAIEAELIKSSNFENLAKLHTISLVGACEGSILVNLLHKLHLSWLVSKPIAEEMATNSDRSRQLVRDLQNGPVHFLRSYTRIASPHDWQVPNYNSTLFESTKYSSLYAIVPGHGHCSIVNAAASAVVERIFSQESIFIE